MNSKAWMLLLGCVSPFAAFGQTGLTPPTESVEQVVEEQEIGATVVPGLAENLGATAAPGPSPRVAPVTEERKPAQAERDAGLRPGAIPPAQARAETPESTRANNAARRGIKAPPLKIKAENGQAIVFSIAVAHLNRIVTPFAKPSVKTTSTAAIATDRGILYVSTTLDEPVSMFVHDADDPTQALSLTMVPAEIPPVSTTVELAGYEPKAAVVTEVSRESAASFESAHPYPQMITTLMRDLALGVIPEGFGFEEIAGPHPQMPACSFGAGVWTEERQLATGDSLLVFVAKVSNRSSIPVELHEEACAQEGVRAVAAWPARIIGPGEATELYVAVDAREAVESGLRRPSLIGGAP